MPVAAQTAWQGLFTHAHLEKGQTILIHGGAGAVGAYAVQLASHVGATVTALEHGSGGGGRLLCRIDPVAQPRGLEGQDLLRFVPLSAIQRGQAVDLVMLVMSEPGELGSAPLSAQERAELQRKKQVVLATLPVAQYPRLVECAAPMTACDDPDFHYDFGINLFIAGVEAISATLPAPDAAR